MCHCKVLDYDYSWAFKLRTSLRINSPVFASCAMPIPEHSSSGLHWGTMCPRRWRLPWKIPEHSSSGLHWGCRIGVTPCSILTFLSIQAQDFIEEGRSPCRCWTRRPFLSIQAQDFIEDQYFGESWHCHWWFLSIQAQDFIEETANTSKTATCHIPEHSSSGLHWGGHTRTANEH